MDVGTASSNCRMLFSHSFILQRRGRAGLARVQSRRAVFLLVDLSLSGPKAKHKGYTCPIPLFSNPLGRVGIGGGRASKLKAKQEENSFCKGSCLLSISAGIKGRQCTRKIGKVISNEATFPSKKTRGQ